jgi:hypothetical protein
MDQIGGTETPSRATAGNGSRRPLGAVVSSVLDGVRTLFHQEIELAKIEVAEAAGARAKGAGLMGAAGVFLLFALVFIAVAGAAALDLVLPRWAAYLIVGGVFVVVGGVLFLAGKSALKSAPKPQRTQETLKEDARWAKRQLAR